MASTTLPRAQAQASMMIDAGINAFSPLVRGKSQTQSEFDASMHQFSRTLQHHYHPPHAHALFAAFSGILNARHGLKIATKTMMRLKKKQK